MRGCTIKLQNGFLQHIHYLPRILYQTVYGKHKLQLQSYIKADEEGQTTEEWAMYSSLCV